jgi:hypothetical protein
MLEKNPQGFDEFGPRYWTGKGESREKDEEARR